MQHPRPLAADGIRRASPNYIILCTLKYGGGDSVLSGRHKHSVFLKPALFYSRYYKYDAETFSLQLFMKARGVHHVPNLATPEWQRDQDRVYAITI